MSERGKESATCPICGETAPTAWYCLLRIAGEAILGVPCNYSLEGQERIRREFDAIVTPPQEPRDG
jgi:hypothetical protein